MITDERFFSFVKVLFHRIADLETRLHAIELVMRVNYATDFVEKVRDISQKIEAWPESKAYRESIDTLDLPDVLDAFEKYRGPVQ